MSSPPSAAVALMPGVPVSSAPPTTCTKIPFTATAPIVVPFPPVMVVRMGTGTSTATPAPPVPTIPPKELPPEVPPNHLDVHKIAISATVATVLLELAAGGLAEVGDGGEVGNDGAAGVEAALQSLEGGGSVVLLLALDVDVADPVVG